MQKYMYVQIRQPKHMITKIEAEEMTFVRGGPAVCVELLNFIRPNLFEVAKGGYVGSTFICLQCEKAKLLLFTRTIYFAS